MRSGRERLVASARPIVHTAVAAPVAWLVATELLGHEQPFFAPISAVVTLGLTIGQRGRRAVEIAFGVALWCSPSAPARSRSRWSSVGGARRGGGGGARVRADVGEQAPLAFARHGVRGVHTSSGAGEAARRAAASANAALEETGNMSALHLIGQVRSTAVDLLRVLGADRASAIEDVRSVEDGG